MGACHSHSDEICGFLLFLRSSCLIYHLVAVLRVLMLMLLLPCSNYYIILACCLGKGLVNRRREVFPFSVLLLFLLHPAFFSFVFLCSITSNIIKTSKKNIYCLLLAKVCHFSAVCYILYLLPSSFFLIFFTEIGAKFLFFIIRLSFLISSL